jgi:hypothetical protein
MYLTWPGFQWVNMILWSLSVDVSYLDSNELTWSFRFYLLMYLTWVPTVNMILWSLSIDVYYLDSNKLTWSFDLYLLVCLTWIPMSKHGRLISIYWCILPGFQWVNMALWSLSVDVSYLDSNELTWSFNLYLLMYLTWIPIS